MAKGVKAVTPVKHGAGKGFMKALSTDHKKPPILLRKDSKHVLEQISSIMTSEDYEDLGNHSTEVMRESRLFAVIQVTMPIDFLFVHSNWLFI